METKIFLDKTWWYEAERMWTNTVIDSFYLEQKGKINNVSDLIIFHSWVCKREPDIKLESVFKWWVCEWNGGKFILENNREYEMALALLEYIGDEELGYNDMSAFGKNVIDIMYNDSNELKQLYTNTIGGK